MAYPVKLAAVLTGASTSQLSGWRRSGLFTPELETDDRRVLYSYRDLVAVRTFVRLRAEGDVSVQRIRKALHSLRDLDLDEHPSSYRFVTDGSAIAILDETDAFIGGDRLAIDLTRKPGSLMGNFSFHEIFDDFQNRQGREVVPFQRPAAGIEVKAGRAWGWPTIAGTRIPYDTISSFVGDDERNYALLDDFWPGVSAEAAHGAVDLATKVAAA